MNLGIDARPLSKTKTGIGFYLYTLIKNLPPKCKDINFFLFSDKEISLDFDYPNLKKVIDDKNRHLKGTLWFLKRANYLVQKFNIDVFWGTQNVLPFINKKDIKKILTVHDLVVFRYPKTMERLNYVINRLLIPYSVKRANKIIAVSNSTKQDILDYFKVEEDKIKVIYNPVNIVSPEHEKEEKYLKTLGVQKNGYILYVGTIEPRKNVTALVDISEDLYKKTGLITVLAGKIGWEKREVLKQIELLDSKGYIKFLQYVAEDEKAILMKNCFAFVFPSLYEGFGLPVVEALKYGALVLVADNSSLKEIIQYEKLRFNPNIRNILREKILQLYYNEDFYSEAKLICRQISGQFNNEDVVDEYTKLLYSIKREGA